MEKEEPERRRLLLTTPMRARDERALLDDWTIRQMRSGRRRDARSPRWDRSRDGVGSVEELASRALDALGAADVELDAVFDSDRRTGRYLAKKLTVAMRSVEELMLAASRV